MKQPYGKYLMRNGLLYRVVQKNGRAFDEALILLILSELPEISFLYTSTYLVYTYEISKILDKRCGNNSWVLCVWVVPFTKGLTQQVSGVNVYC